MPYKDREKRLECLRGSTARWYQKNKEIHLKNTANNYKNWKSQLFDILGHECAVCGYKDKRALQFDHINGGGIKDSNKRGGSMVRYYVKRPITALLTLQVLCANCNWIKRTENDELYHYKRRDSVTPKRTTR